jgi:hypothetical protein
MSADNAPFSFNQSYERAMAIQKQKTTDPLYLYYPNALRVTSMPTATLSSKCLAGFRNQEQSEHHEVYMVSSEDSRLRNGYGSMPTVCDVSVIRPGERPRVVSREVCVPPGVKPLFCDGQSVNSNASLVPSWIGIPESEFDIDSGRLDPRRCYGKSLSQI